MYVLNVDLWSEDALKEVNLVRHTTATPSISSTSPASYAQIEQTTPAYSHILPSSRDMGYSQQMAYPPPQGQSVSPYGMQQSYGQGRFFWSLILTKLPDSLGLTMLDKQVSFRRMGQVTNPLISTTHRPNCKA